jgi:aubergine-like protein
LSYVLLNKKNTLKVFQVENKNYSNIPPGTLVDDIVVGTDSFDFFLISQKTNQGLSQATHYNVIYDDFYVKTEELHYFIYKMCYLYYNWTGGIKIPAPCQYAKKLAFLVGDKLSSKKEFNLPDGRFLNEIRSLYFL